MASLRPVEFWGLEVPAGAGQVPVVSLESYPVSFRLTMAAIDPTAAPLPSDAVNGQSNFTGATLRIVRIPNDEDDDDEDDEDYDVSKLLGGPDSDDDEDNSEMDEDINGGPSDPEKSPKARRKAALQRLRNEFLNADDNEVDDVEAKASLKAKGKAKALNVDDLMLEDGSEESIEQEEFVICTLDTTKTYQQPLDITINDHETVFFSATGTHSVYLTGNIVIPDDDGDYPRANGYDSDEDDEDIGEYDLSPDEDELELPDDEDESDDLDDLSDPRIEELDDSDNGEEAPKLVNGNAKSKNKKKKRPADDSDDENIEMATSLDDLISQEKAESGAQALSQSQLKKQRKKMKNNEGQAIEAVSTVTKDSKGTKATVEVSKQSPGKADKKVQFAKTLVQGPSSSSSPSPGVRKDDTKSSKATESVLKTNGVEKTKTKDKPATGVRNVQGVTVDDRKLGSGPAAKKGDKVSMRYIGKLEKDKRVFDSNKKGTPFTFKLGASQVIKGWELGVAGMAVGGERRIIVPPHLAYGSKAMPDIPANSTLVFDLKLLEIK